MVYISLYWSSSIGWTPQIFKLYFDLPSCSLWNVFKLGKENSECFHLRLHFRHAESKGWCQRLLVQCMYLYGETSMNSFLWTSVHPWKLEPEIVFETDKESEKLPTRDLRWIESLPMNDTSSHFSFFLSSIRKLFMIDPHIVFCPGLDLS